MKADNFFSARVGLRSKQMLSAIDVDSLTGQEISVGDARKKTLPTKSAPVSASAGTTKPANFPAAPKARITGFLIENSLNMKLRRADGIGKETKR